MIDWIKAVVPVANSGDISAGFVSAVTADGEVEWSVRRRLAVEGSHSSKVQVRSLDPRHLEIDGNPSKFLQGHNVFGSNNLMALCGVFFREVASRLGLPLSPEEFSAIDGGGYSLKRVDIAESFRLPSQEDVATWLRSATSSIRGKHQATSAYHGETIYLGQHSRRISLKAYNKYRELQKKGRLAKEFPFRQALMEHAKPLLRLEVTVRRLELKRRGLLLGSDWQSESIATDLLWERIGTIKMNQKMRLKMDEIDELPPRLRAVYKLWTQGEDLRSTYPKATYYRYRGELLREVGIDISVPKPQKAEVIPLIRYLTAEYVPEVPAWARGTSAAFDPEDWSPCVSATS